MKGLAADDRPAGTVNANDNRFDAIIPGKLTDFPDPVVIVKYDALYFDPGNEIAAAKRAAGVTCRLARSHIRAIIWRLAGNRHIMDMAFTQAGIGNAQKSAIGLHLGNGAVTGVAHRRP